MEINVSIEGNVCVPDDSAVPRSYCACRNHSPESLVINEKLQLFFNSFVGCQMNILFHPARASTTGNLLISQPIHLIHQPIDLPDSCIDFAPGNFTFLVRPLTRREHRAVMICQSFSL